MPFTAEIHAESTIDATPEEVWRVLADTAAYPEWNPFVVALAGTLAEGERISVTIRDRGGKDQRFRPRLLDVSPGERLVWLGRAGAPGIFDGEHRFELHPTEDGRTRVVHAEGFRGLLVPLLRRRLERDVAPQFAVLNEPLAARVASATAAHASA